ncbi:flavin reductase family protein [Candidatus Fermentibacterales bacterium]|nr:flavin reductase family protein [Candidatus Fermentibacterales bacterium]
MSFEEVGTRDPRVGNVFRMIADSWMLVTAGDIQRFNTMTASWGFMGEIWNRDVCVAVVRPQRYTFGFMEASDGFTLSFFDDGHGVSERDREVLSFCGSHSGRDTDKLAATGLEPFDAGAGRIGFRQASLILVARKLYAQDLEERLFLDPGIPREVYPTKDFHRMYVGEIERVLARGTGV